MGLLQRAILAGMFTLAGTMGAYELASASGLRVNIEESMPLGVYWFVPGPVVQGNIVQSCLPKRIATYALQHHYLVRGGSCSDGLIPVIKVLAATSDDSINISAHAVTIDGHVWPMSSIRRVDSSGHRVDLHLPLGPYRCSQNSVFLMGEHPRSWDSRYWGCVPQTSIAGRWVPIPFTGWIASLIISLSQERVS